MFHSNPGEMGKQNLETMDRYIDIDTALRFHCWLVLAYPAIRLQQMVSWM